MKIEKVQIGNKKVMPFTIPSGIVTTEVSCLERIANEIPEIGILTTKSIGPEPRAGNREPILAQYLPGSFVNAVGLTNPGADEFAKKLSNIIIPKDRFLLASIFGKDASEFAYVAKTLEPQVDGFELNLSCPHAEGHGLAVGQDKKLSDDVVKTVVGMTKKPVFVKLSPNLPNIAEAAESAMKSGAYGIVAINTVGPGCYMVDGAPVLTNKVGGMSGQAILPIGIKCTRDISQKLGKIPIIGMGGIATAADVKNYAAAGASFFGIGSALAGMTEAEMKEYFSTLVKDLNEGTWDVECLRLIKGIGRDNNRPHMEYRKAKIVKKIDAACDFKLLETNRLMGNGGAGQFVFAWIPEFGEKPFSIIHNNPLTLGILEKGEFTKKINSMKEGDSFYVRGPYGKCPELHKEGYGPCVLVGGGCGSAGLHLLLGDVLRQSDFSGNDVTVLLGAKDKEHIAYLNRFKRCKDVRIATEDGSLGLKGTILDLFKSRKIPQKSYFYNCGPKAMVDAILPLELAISSPERVYFSLDYMTSCGIGICGKCADEKGRRTCVEGPFMNAR